MTDSITAKESTLACQLYATGSSPVCRKSVSSAAFIAFNLAAVLSLAWLQGAICLAKFFP